MKIAKSIRLVERLFSKPFHLATSHASRLRLELLGVECAGGLTLHGAPVVSLVSRSRILLGRDVVLCSKSANTALGINHSVVLRSLLPGAELVIGDEVGISGGSICAGRRVEIGAGSMLGANVTIADTDFHPIASNRRRGVKLSSSDCIPVIIGKNVFVGTNSVILKGVRIGANSVIGANSTVACDIPAGVVAAGNPCRVLREIADPNSAAHED